MSHPPRGSLINLSSIVSQHVNKRSHLKRELSSKPASIIPAFPSIYLDHFTTSIRIRCHGKVLPPATIAVVVVVVEAVVVL